MNILVLLLAVVIPFPLCLFRMKKFGISLKKMLLIYVVVSTVGAIGACVGSAVDGGTIMGKRLYGLMLFDTVLLFALSPLVKVEQKALCDFVAVPIMAVCFASKIDCIVKDCCHGIVLYRLENNMPVRFPSAIMEMTIWGIMTILLVLIERSGKARGLLWPIGMVWFGLARFLADYMRGAWYEREILLLGLTGGRFWSLVTLLLGLVILFVFMTQINGRKPGVKEMGKALLGNGVEASAYQ